MTSLISIEMPFSWCYLCRAIDLESEKMFIFDAPGYERHKCKNEHLCMRIFEAQENWKKTTIAEIRKDDIREKFNHFNGGE